MMAAVAILAALSAEAQKIRTIDKEGQPVPYVSVMTTDTKYIGVTDLDGVLNDVKGADTIMVSHVAYKPARFKVGAQGGTITLEDADFGLPEIVVSKRPYTYVQTYYRTYYYTEDDGILYYRVGLTDNVYDSKTGKVKGSTVHTSKAKWGILKTTLNALIGGILDKQSQISPEPIEEYIVENGKKTKTKITDEGAGRKRISDFKGTIGYITDNKSTGLRRFSYDNNMIRKHKIEADGNTKKLDKEEKRETKKKNRQDVDFLLYRIDDEGNYQPEDFVMSQILVTYDEVQNDGSLVAHVICSQVFTIERAYANKNELKQLKQENKMKMTYQNILQFERDNKIPALEPRIQEKLNQLWKTGE